MQGEMMKTSFLIVASMFTATGATLYAAGDYVTGTVMLLLAVGTLVLRGYLKAKGIIDGMGGPSAT